MYNYKDGKNLRIKNLIKLQDFYNKHIAEYAQSSKPTITQTTQGKFEKVSLLDEVAIIDSLKNGKTVISSSTGKRYKLIDGLIVNYSSGGLPLFINSAIDLSDKEGYYCLQPVPLKLKVGGKYNRTDGIVGNVFAVDNDEYYVVFEGDTKLWKYNINGKCLDGDLDLITEVE